MESLSDADSLTLASFEESMSFTSMRTTYNEEELEEKGIDDELLATLLNPDGKIQIGDYVISVDVMADDVAVLSNIDGTEQHFSIDDEVLYILFDSVTQSDPIVIDGGISQLMSSTSSERLEQSIQIACLEQDTVKFKLKYQRAGIYFSIVVDARYKMFQRNSLLGWEIKGYNNQYVIGFDAGPGTYTRNRRNANQITIPRRIDSGVNRCYTYRPYSKACGLKQFSLSSLFSVYDDEGFSRYFNANIFRN